MFLAWTLFQKRSELHAYVTHFRLCVRNVHDKNAMIPYFCSEQWPHSEVVF